MSIEREALVELLKNRSINIKFKTSFHKRIFPASLKDSQMYFIEDVEEYYIYDENEDIFYRIDIDTLSKNITIK